MIERLARNTSKEVVPYYVKHYLYGPGRPDHRLLRVRKGAFDRHHAGHPERVQVSAGRRAGADCRKAAHQRGKGLQRGHVLRKLFPGGQGKVHHQGV